MIYVPRIFGSKEKERERGEDEGGQEENSERMKEAPPREARGVDVRDRRRQGEREPRLRGNLRYSPDITYHLRSHFNLH